MSAKKPYARIAITLPEEDLAAADRLAAQADRSRSWIVAEAIRHYAAAHEAREHGHTALDGSRRAQLRRDVALTPEERVREAEATERLAEVTLPRRFSSFDAFLAAQRKARYSE